MTNILHKDEYCTIELTNGVISVVMEHETLVPSPEAYPNHTTARQFSGLYRELVDGGIPETVAWMWIDQAMGIETAEEGEREGQAIVEAAYNAVKRPSGRAYLADMRKAAGIAREAFDAGLVALQSAGRIALYGLDDPREIRPEYEEGAWKTAFGDVRHIAHMGLIG